MKNSRDILDEPRSTINNYVGKTFSEEMRQNIRAEELEIPVIYK